MFWKTHLLIGSFLTTAAMAEIPDPLAFQGKTVTSAQAWRDSLRPLTLKHFREEIYGITPIGKPADFEVKVIREDPQALEGKATLKELEITAAGRKFHPLLVTPNGAKSPAATFVLFGFGKPDIEAEDSKFGAWPVRDIIARGYATVSFHVSEVDPDRVDGFAEGVRAGFPKTADSWGALAAWGWGASRIMDYLETNPAIDAKRVAVIGHSRCGKAALWCGANDERFSYVIANNSGCSGAALARTKKGERIANITSRFPYWFCENYQKYGNNEDALPVDHHQLLGLIAPRLLYVASATLDEWADGPSEFESCVRAGPVFKLLGKNGLESTTMPAPDHALLDGGIGYHIRTGKHDLAASDWQHYMDYADKHWK